MGRVLAIDPGDVRIGLALSDPSRTIARPLSVVDHVSRQIDAETILRIAEENEADLILIGLPLDHSGEVGPQGRKSLRMLDQLQALAKIQVETWDESWSTETARELSSDKDLVDAIAAAVFLQDYLDATQD